MTTVGMQLPGTVCLPGITGMLKLGKLSLPGIVTFRVTKGRE